MAKFSDNPAQRREFIKYQLRLRGTNLAEVGRELGVTTATMSQVCIGARQSARVIKALADKLGVPTDELKSAIRQEDSAM